MKKLTIGILAHVDAGKTTLSESILYRSGSIRKLGRVDNRDAFLDTNELERARGITIFSKQAQVKYDDLWMTLLDTPGHVDFSAEMERTLQVLDYAILVISGADGVQGHTQTLWQLLSRYQIPTFLFINKMDQQGTDREMLLLELQRRLHEGCLDFSSGESEEFLESLAMGDEDALEEFLASGQVRMEERIRLIAERKIFPCYFGSALKVTGVDEFLEGLRTYTGSPAYTEEFGAKVFKISRDDQGNRLTHVKITGGTLKVKGILVDEKVNQIRVYHGERFEAVNEAEAGTVCAVTGLSGTYAGQGFGVEAASEAPVLEPVLTYQIQLPDGVDAGAMVPKLRELEEEEPELHIVWDETLQEIQAQIMGDVQIEILKSLILERFGVDVSFGAGNIVYKETIAAAVEGVGHFEPLRHYAEVHLLLEPGEQGSGLVFSSSCREDSLDKNWQRLILTHLEEKQHIGVLTGAAITDMHITLTAGRAHTKHTEGGDFRQATYRAVRQGLRQAENILLEPYYSYRLEIPEGSVGRAMMDLEKRKGTMEAPTLANGFALLTGEAPVITLRGYAREVTAYTKGQGKIFCTLAGYRPCHNAEEVIAAAGYDPEADINNPTGSVFCAHGAGFLVPWDQVPEYMHVESTLSGENGESADEVSGTEVKKQRYPQGMEKEEAWIDTEEIDAILNRTFHANRRKDDAPRRGIPGRRRHERDRDRNAGYAKTVTSAGITGGSSTAEKAGREYLLVDGYNIIFAWDELKALAEKNIDGARGRLMDILSNYQGMKKCELMLVFDAYRVQGHETEVLRYHNIYVVYTKEAETADQYIEKFAHENGRKYQVTVATSDGLEQIIIRGQGCRLLSARELDEEIRQTSQKIREDYLDNPVKKRGEKTYLLDHVSEEIAEQLKLTK